uniref:Tyrosine-protein kinase n=1 Tax=Ciona savignyi TaxID=51511 RepID=H2YD17_CIOSA
IDFSSTLLGKPSHDALIRLQDYELKFLEIIRKTVVGRIEHDRKYANSLSQLANTSIKIENAMYGSPLYNAWKEIAHSLSQTSLCLKKSTDFLQSSTLDKVVALTKDKTALRKYYIEHRERIDHKFVKTIYTELDKKHSNYIKLENDVAQAHKAYDAAMEKGKLNPMEKAQDKYRKTTMKLHHAHNDYTLQVMEAQLHQHQYRNAVLPELLSGIQEMQVQSVEALKEALHEFLTHSSPCRAELVSAHKEAENAVINIDPNTEYQGFVDSFSTPLEPEAMVTYEAGKGEAAQLAAGEIVLNNLSMQGVEHLAQGFQDDLEQVQIEIDDLKQTLSNTRRGNSLMSKQLECVSVKRQLTEQENLQHMMQNMHYVVHNAIQKLGDNDPPVGLHLTELDSISTASGSSNFEVKNTMEGAKKHITLIISTPRTLYDNHKSVMNQSKTIREQTWFHGTIPRAESLRLLRQDGDFLLRESNNAKGELVLSAKAEGQVRHFKVQNTDNGMYRFEGDNFTSILNLISHHYTKREPVTKKTNCLLINPVCKDKWQLSHDDFRIENLGKGNFGEVSKALFIRENIYVAVKTCKEDVDQNTRDKFLEEAKILKGYDHDNIVRLIGVCTDRQPIYIVMEYVSGGDLVKYLRQNADCLLTQHLVQFCHDACRGLAYLEEKKCIHRHKQTQKNINIKQKRTIVHCFGGGPLNGDVLHVSVDGVNTILFLTRHPEVRRFTTASDVWSFSILSWEIFNCGAQPYPRMTNHTAKEKVEKGYRMPQPDRCPYSYYTEVMQKAWEYDAKLRPRFSELVVTIDRVLR